MIIKKINQFLDEDLPTGDITTESTIVDDTTIEAKIIAMENMIFSGEQIIPHCFGKTVDVDMNKKDGEQISSDTIIATIKGSAKLILSRERIMLNLIQRLCGIATNTRIYVDLAKPFNVKILDTRKTTPGIREFEKYAVKCGGGYNHRLNLSTGILIKDNHIQAAGSIKKALRKIDRELWIELEVDTITQIKEGLLENVNGFLLDNMNPEKIKECVDLIKSYPNSENIFIEASGGINLTNINPYLNTGIDGISIGALTHQIKSCDIKLEFE
tara:strand:- start:133 stop:945 length:813 start_codon:yes stop_codon:yes gene_type:complete